jgi:hypothetical protein
MLTVKSAGGALGGMGGADDGGWPGGILICEVNWPPSVKDAEVMAATCVKRLRVSNTWLLVPIIFR